MIVIFISVAHGPIGLLRNKIISSFLILRIVQYKFDGIFIDFEGWSQL